MIKIEEKTVNNIRMKYTYSDDEKKCLFQTDTGRKYDSAYDFENSTHTYVEIDKE